MNGRTVLFDWDGTLVDNWPVIHAALNAVFAERSMPAWTFAETMRRVSRSQRDSFPKLFGADWPRARDSFYAAFEARHLACLTVLPGAEGCLDRLAGDGWRLAVVSNKKGEYLRRELAHLGWTGRFAAAVGAGDAPADKPSGAPVRLAGGCAVWLVGDSDTDIATARNAGLRSLVVPYRGGPAPVCRPYALCDSLPAAAELVISAGRYI